jgi:transcriptional regulator with XRE-family HTH domain
MAQKLFFEEQLAQSLIKKGKGLANDQEVISAGALILLLRQSLQMNQRQLAQRAGVPHSTISRIERGEMHPNEDTLHKIFAAMECDIAFVPVPRFKNIPALLREKAKRLAEKRLIKVEGTMALEKQRPEKKWRHKLLESEIERILQSPSQLWDEDAILLEI